MSPPLEVPPPGTPIRLIASDLDGTVLGRDFRFRPRTVEALRAAQDSGLHVVFVTGRPMRWLDPLREQLAHEGVVICSNGAVVYDLAADRVVETSLFPVHEAFAVMDEIAARHPGSLFAAETLEGVYTDHGWARTDRMESGAPRTGPLREQVPAEPGLVKFLAKRDGADPHAYVRALTELVGGRLSVTSSVAGTPLVEMGQRGLTKARTLTQYAAERGIGPHEVLAFGDMPNDLEMLTWAGHGYAMADGHPAVVRAVGRTAPPFAEDGVARVIEALLREQTGERPAGQVSTAG
ncbi:Cof-type HAD-IIB family hydrolase [Kocuria flava]|uniref:HAD family hydrolase n=1 Tax=Kocuria flava TaxID=446860 RepID=UPI001FF52358|nr:HAD family hydrolase [Kocuria flava]MCJ8506048.1 Cof-type HAD-IIB family hydrolase [Kocuria flava]